MGNSGTLAKMLVTAFTDSSFKKQKGQMSVMINPEQYSQSYEIIYDNTQAQGSPAGSPEFNRIPSDTLVLQLIFDGTGVVPSAIPGTPPAQSDGIVKQVDAFLKLAFDYSGTIHSPNFLQLSWGTLLFGCRLQTLKMTYTLFKPDGTPLRAKADTTFIGYQNEQEIAQEVKDSSPDLTHEVTVKSGDTLPLLCYDIYGSSVYYARVAAVNGLTGFRELIPGTRLVFPPLGSGSGSSAGTANQ